MSAWAFIQYVQGQNILSTYIAAAKIQKTGGVDATFDAGVASVQKIAGDGFIECVAGTNVATTFSAIGFSADDPGVTRDEIDYALYLRGGLLAFFANGVDAGIYPVLAAGDQLRLQRVGTSVTAWLNGNLQYTFPVASFGSLLVDTSFYSLTTPAIINNIRLYDATTKTFPALTWQGPASAANTNVTVSQDPAKPVRKMVFAAPSKVQAGDELIFVLAAAGTEFVSSIDSTMDYVDTIASATSKRGFQIYRRRATAAEPSSYTFNLSVTHDCIGALLVYRNVDVASASLGSSAVDIVATSLWTAPARTFVKPTDLFLGVALQLPNAAGGIIYPFDCTSRAEFVQAQQVFQAMRLAIFDYAPDVIGLTNTKSFTFISSGSGACASILLPGVSPPGNQQRLSYLPPAPGAIGLPIDGV